MLLIAIAAAAAYANSFPGIFLFDDASSIIDNASIRPPWHPGSLLVPPREAGVSGRPLVNLTLALNHAISGLQPWSYHAVNLAIHIGAACALFGVVRRTLLLSALRARFSESATSLAAASALLWALHPLASIAVNYVSQRTESLMAWFYLLVLYGFARSAESGSIRWKVFAMVSCALGMASKEVMITAPLMVLLYDRVFVAGAWGRALESRWKFHLGLAATWLVLGGLMITSQPEERGIGFDLGVTMRDYALTQSRALLLYLRRALWPEPLVFDHGWAFERGVTAALPYVLGCGGLLIGSLVALRRRPHLGYVGCAVLLLLAPTTSLIPIIHQPIAESRMYLPLAVLSAAFVVLQYWALGRRAMVLIGTAILALAVITVQRNATFRDEVSLWSDTVSKCPDNARAYGNLSGALLRAGRIAEAVAAGQTAIRLRPGYADAHQNLALAFMQAGRVTEALDVYEHAVRTDAVSPDTHYNFALALLQVGRSAEAVEQFETALRLNPHHAWAHNNLSVVLLPLGRVNEAVDHARLAAALRPEFAEAHYNLGNALAQRGERDSAAESYQTALRLQPGFAKAHHNLGVIHLQAGDARRAIEHFEAALRIDPSYASARKNLEQARSPPQPKPSPD